MRFRRDVIGLETPELALSYGLVPWDTDIFGFAVAQIDRFDLLGGDPEASFGHFESWRDAARVRLVSCRLHHGKLRESMFLEDHGFRFVEMVFNPRLEHLDRVAPPEHAPSISEASDADIPIIERIAGDAFTTGRFLLDRRLDPALSAERYRVWVRGSFRDPKHRVLKATIDGEIVGFFITEDGPDNSVYWHLTAIAPGWQGRGIGTSLWASMLIRHRDTGRSSVETTISAHNAPVLNLYARLGFRFPPPSLTMHWTDSTSVTRER